MFSFDCMVVFLCFCSLSYDCLSLSTDALHSLMIILYDIMMFLLVLMIARIIFNTSFFNCVDFSLCFYCLYVVLMFGLKTSLVHHVGARVVAVIAH